MKRVSIQHQKLLRGLVCVFIRVAIDDVGRGADALAGSVVCIFVGDIGIRPLAFTIYGCLRLRLGLGFDQRCASQFELLFAMCRYPC
jgi:hypothetical protein